MKMLMKSSVCFIDGHNERIIKYRSINDNYFTFTTASGVYICKNRQDYYRVKMVDNGAGGIKTILVVAYITSVNMK